MKALNGYEESTLNFTSRELKFLECCFFFFFAFSSTTQESGFLGGLSKQVQKRLDEMAEREGRSTSKLQSEQRGKDQVQSRSDIYGCKSLICTTPDSWQRDPAAPYWQIVPYNRRIYFLDLWVKDLEKNLHQSS